jgi:hypothetical protein
MVEKGNKNIALHRCCPLQYYKPVGKTVFVLEKGGVKKLSSLFNT